MKKQKLFIYGASGHAKVVIEIAERLSYSIGGLVDADPAIQQLLDYPVNTPFVINADDKWIIGIGNNNIRRKIAEGENRIYATLCHPSANISSRAQIGEGTVVMAGVSINSEVRIAKHCIINTNASIDHDCNIADYVHISPNVALAGDVSVGQGTHIGIGACVIQGIKIGKWCTIGAGAVVIRDVPDGARIVGNPARSIKST